MAAGFCLPDNNQLVGFCIDWFCYGSYCIDHIKHSNNPVSNSEPGKKFENRIINCANLHNHCPFSYTCKTETFRTSCYTGDLIVGTGVENKGRTIKIKLKIAMLELKGIYKWINTGNNRTFLLKDVNLSIKEGEFISIMGPSGSGKSTLLNVIGMLDEFNEGEYHFLHESVHKLKEKQRSSLYKQYIGFVFQAYHLIDELTVYENIETPLIYQNIKTADRKAMVADILDRFQIVGKKDLFPTQLSGGQQQLVGIARALIVKPKLILADEPTGNLNSKQGEEIMELFKELNNEGVRSEEH